MRMGFIHRIDEALFSHAGWARPQYNKMQMYPEDLFQVVGHTPVKEALHQGNVLTIGIS